MNKIKVLWHSDFLVPTGFGNVAEAIMSRLLKTQKYEFTVIAINHDGSPITSDSPYCKFKDLSIKRAEFGADPLGRAKVLQTLDQGNFDIFFALQDTFNMVSIFDALQIIKKRKKFSYILYFPVDSDLEMSWVKQAIAVADYPVVYTQYGKMQISKHAPALAEKCSIIHHGADTETFYPISAEERIEVRKHYFNSNDNDFIVTNVNRNQPRKDLPRTIMVFQNLKKLLPQSKLYLNTNIMDHDGVDIVRFIDRYCPEIKKSILYPVPNQMHLITNDVLRSIYGASDVVISTTMGEGWGLSTTEAMACKVPVIMPRNTSSIEIIGENEERGRLAECSDFYVNYKRDNGTIRPITDIDDMVKHLAHVNVFKNETNEKVEAAYSWIKDNCNWDTIAEKWDAIFTKAYQENQSR